MGRFKMKKKSTFIDMTAMSDVTVLLLTFFMLTSTFVKPEPVKVNTPGSISEIAKPENDLLTIYVEKSGRIFMTMSKRDYLNDAVSDMNTKFDLGLTEGNVKTFREQSLFGTPLNQLKLWLDAPEDDMKELLTNSGNKGISCDTTNNEFKEWVQSAKVAIGAKMRIAIKADAETPYKVIKNVMNSLQDLNENRYNLLTSLKGMDDK